MLYVNQERMKHVSCLSSFNYISWQLNNQQKKTRLYQTLIVDEEGLIQLRDRPFIISNKIMGQASLVAQKVKNLPAMQETRVQPLIDKDLLEKEMAILSSILS